MVTLLEIGGIQVSRNQEEEELLSYLEQQEQQKKKQRELHKRFNLPTNSGPRVSIDDLSKKLKGTLGTLKVTLPKISDSL